MAEDVNLQASGYDEDLCENPFFKYMQTKQKQIYEEAASKRWTVGLITQIFGIEFLQKTDAKVTSLLLFTELIKLSPLHFSVIINVTSRVNLGKCLIKILEGNSSNSHGQTKRWTFNLPGVEASTCLLMHDLT